MLFVSRLEHSRNRNIMDGRPFRQPRHRSNYFFTRNSPTPSNKATLFRKVEIIGEPLPRVHASDIQAWSTIREGRVEQESREGRC